MNEIRTHKASLAETAQYDISQQVLRRRCLLKDTEGNIIETPEQMYVRVAETVVSVESAYGTTKDMIQKLLETCSKRTMINTDFHGQNRVTAICTY